MIEHREDNNGAGPGVETLTDRHIASRGKLQQRQWISLQGTPLRAFEIVNSRGRMLAIGALSTSTDSGFCVMHAKRYRNDHDLVAAIEKLTGIKPR